MEKYNNSRGTKGTLKKEGERIEKILYKVSISNCNIIDFNDNNAFFWCLIYEV